MSYEVSYFLIEFASEVLIQKMGLSMKMSMEEVIVESSYRMIPRVFDEDDTFRIKYCMLDGRRTT